MRNTREVLRLHFEAGLSERDIAQSCSIARSTVQECLRRFRAAELSWPLPAELDEVALEAKLYAPTRAVCERALPDWAQLHEQLQPKGMTRWLLWQEYKSVHPDGLQYSAFCERYLAWRKTQAVVLRQVHAPGEKLFIDYAGQQLGVVDPHTGEVHPASIFVAVLGCSNYTYAEATLGQRTQDWLGAQSRALQFIGGVPAAIVCDNPKTLITKAHRYDPDLNPSYQDFAEHYGVAVLPARVAKPRDKAKVEGAVLIVERWILARLRSRTFFSLAELNAAIAELLTELNQRAFKKLPGSRASRFEQLERAALKPLPARAYEFGAWKKAKVHLDYHVEVEQRYYSAPYTYIGKTLDVRVTARMVELFWRGKLLGAHVKARQVRSFNTLDAHRPPKHRAVVELSQARLTERALAVGTGTAEVLQRQWQRRQHPEQTLRAALGILRLAKDFDAVRLEAACLRALQLNAANYRSIRALIQIGNAYPSALPSPQLGQHDNVRGPSYFN